MTHLRQLFRKSRLLFSSVTLRCSLYCNSCCHGNTKKITSPGDPTDHCVLQVCTTGVYYAPPCPLSCPELWGRTEAENKLMLKWIKPGTGVINRCDRCGQRPKQFQQQPLVPGLSQVVDKVSQSRLSGLQLLKQNLWKQQGSGLRELNQD